MFASLVAVASALVWGTGDYLGGRASRRRDPLAVTLVSIAAGLPVLAILAVLTWSGPPRAVDIAWGAAAGLAGFGGLSLLYRGLANGAMAVVAPVTAVTSAGLPLLLGLFLDRVPGPLPLVGACLAVVAIGAVSLGHHDRGPAIDARIVGTALSSGVLFGGFFVLLDQADPDSGTWPLVAVRLTGLLAAWATLAVLRRPVRLDRAAVRLSIYAGGFDALAAVLYLFAVHRGALSVVAPLAALYPVSTVVLAYVVDRERIRAVQFVGLGCAVAALALTAS